MSANKLKIPLFKVFMAPESALLPRLRQVLYSGEVGEGQPVYDFEQRFGEFIGQPNVLSFNSGTAALHSALLLAGVKPGDEVISTAMTAEPTNVAIMHSGATIVWADIDPANGNISAQSIAERITGRTKAIMVVHYGGIPASLNAIRAAARSRGIIVIEDAAHGLGARYDGNHLGGGSDYVMFSFQAIKHLTTVDGGGLVCRDPADLPRGRRLRWFGIDRKMPRTEMNVTELGYKYHMNNLNATIGFVQLEHIEPALQRHIENGRFFDRELGAVSGVKLCRWDANAEPSYWFYTVLAENRDNLSRWLSENGIANSLVHRRNDQHQLFARSRRELPGLDSFYSRMLHIPCGWWVTDEDRQRIVDAFRAGW